MRIPHPRFARSNSRREASFAHATWVKHLTATAAALAWVIALFGVAHAQSAGQTYKSPQKDYTIEVPSLIFGTNVEKWHNKDDGAVVFSGKTGQLQRIDNFRIPPDNPVPADSIGRHDRYRRMIDALVQGHDGQWLAEREIVIDGIHMVEGLVRIPGGAALLKNGKPMDSVQGILVFTRGGFTYVLREEVGFPVFYPGGEVPGTEGMLKRADELLNELYRAMVFR